MADENEDDLLRSVALQNAQAILLARQRAEQELIQAKEALEQTTKELAHAKELFQNVFDQAAVGIARIDATGRWLMVNPRLCEMLGYTPEELLAVRLPQLAHPDEVAADSEMMLRLLSGEARVYHREKRYLRKDGTVVWVNLTLSVERETARAADRSFIAVIQDITERKQIEEALQESEERLELAVEAGGIGTFEWNIRTNAVAWTEQSKAPFARPSRVSRGVYDDWARRVHPEDQLVLEARIQEAFRKKQHHWQVEYRMMSFDTAEERWINSRGHIFYDGQGEPLRMIGVNIDITERKRAEAALKDSERRLALALDSAQMGMWDLDLLTDTSVRSLRHDQIFGYSSPVPTWGAAIFMTHVVPEDREVAKRAFEKAFESDNFDMECRILWADKSIHWVSAKGRVYRNPKGDPVRMMGTVQDITDRKRAEEALQRSEREFRELAESMPQIVWATTPDGLNIYFNQQWVDYTGLTLEESYGEGWITPFHPDDRQRAWDAWQRATQHRDTYSLECRLRRADGVYQWWLIRGVPLLSANGEISKWFGTCTDIEQIKVAEQRLKESEAKFSGIISISADAIISIDGEQRITLFNNGAEQIFGYSKSEAIGAPLDILIPDRFRKRPSPARGAVCGRQRDRSAHGRAADNDRWPAQER